MKKFLKHTKEKICLGCEDRLTESNPYMCEWFRDMKSKNLSLHCSWVFRDQASQDDAFVKGVSKVRWPNSQHNVKDPSGKPASRAIDIFQIIDGIAIFDPVFCSKINTDSKEKYKLLWGGTFKTLGDYGHFQMLEEK